MYMLCRSGLVLILLCLLTVMTAKAKQPKTYQLQYHATINPETEQAEVQITLPDTKLINSINFRLDEEFHSKVQGNGELVLKDGRAIWQPPEKNARLSYTVNLNHERSPASMTLSIKKILPYSVATTLFRPPRYAPSQVPTVRRPSPLNCLNIGTA